MYGGLTMSSAAIFQIQSTINLIVFFLGIYWRKRPKRHVPLMGVGIFWDICLILQIELTRKAVAKATKVIENPLILTIHIALALSTVLLYLALIYLGRKLLKGENQYRSIHSLLGKLAMGLRILTYITSFFVA